MKSKTTDNKDAIAALRKMANDLADETVPLSEVSAVDLAYQLKLRREAQEYKSGLVQGIHIAADFLEGKKWRRS